jgi:16S rRNA (cytosine1402-N4)-methyltransferase
MNEVHIPVLLNEAINGLNIKEDGIYVDATMGGAGHSSEILKRLKSGHLYAFDQDDYAIKRSSEVLSKVGDNFTLIKANFVNIKTELSNYGIEKIDGVLYDLGVSSFQFDIGDRGFSYNHDAKLDMRMDLNKDLTAYDIVNTYSDVELKKIFYTYGEEKFAPLIAKKIVVARKLKAIETTFELSEIIKSSLPAYARRAKGHPAKQVFQALRIAVNDELNVFERSLNDALNLLNPSGRIAVITFHSLEDRICKQVFRSKVEVFIPRGLAIKEVDIKRDFRLINNKVIIPTEAEITENNRSRSAKLRIIEKL